MTLKYFIFYLVYNFLLLKSLCIVTVIVETFSVKMLCANCICTERFGFVRTYVRRQT